jgi:hypothetical protein
MLGARQLGGAAVLAPASSATASAPLVVDARIADLI